MISEVRPQASGFGPEAEAESSGRWLHPSGMTELADCVVKDVEGRDVRVGDLWRDGPVVLVFVRHFG